MIAASPSRAGFAASLSARGILFTSSLRSPDARRRRRLRRIKRGFQVNRANRKQNE